MDHLAVMFGEELPPWDLERKYQPQNLQVRIQRYLQRDTNIVHLMLEFKLDVIRYQNIYIF